MTKNRSPEAPVARPRATSTQLAGARPRWERLRPRVGTLVAFGLAGAAVALAWADPFFEPDNGALLVNNRSGARRVFPTLVDADPSKATIELQASDGPVVRIVPASDGGHQLMHGDVVLGPVADEDFEGLWSSLRLATAQRSAEKAHGVGQAGVIRVSLPDASLTLSLGDAAPGSGVYGVFEADGAAWVVETEMLTLVQQPPKSWLSKRLLPIDVELVSGLAWGDELVLARGGDDFWRVRSGDAPALLSSEAVGFRLRRLLRAQLDPFIEREAVASESLRPWLVVTTVDGSSRALHVGGECPGHPRKRLVDRGPGLLGCVPADLLERWPLLEPDANMIEPRLIPHDYGRIVGIDLNLPALEQPVERKLIRRGGEWFYTGEGGVETVAEEEVRRWYQEVGKLEVALWTAARPDGEPVEQIEPGSPDSPGMAPPEDMPFEPSWGLIVHADTGEQLVVRCELERVPVRCLRDDGVLLRVLGDLPRDLAFEAETFAARRLTAIGPGEVRELEILPIPDTASTTVRQSVHADMGTWELDAPEHPDDSGAVDTVRLENLLWALRGLRAESWVAVDDAGPLRQIIAEVVPEQGRRHTVNATLYPNCVIAVEGQRPAAIGKAQCAALSEDLLFDDPLRFWLERSRGLEVARADSNSGSVFLRRRDEQFVTGEGTPLDDPELAKQLQTWIDWRSQGIHAGQPSGEIEWTLDIRRELGPAVQVDIGAGWARIRGADWYYVERDPETSPTVPVTKIDEVLDPEGVELD
jgi:hypothetical protein